jgi:SAM-dependent methyltransferase
MTMPADRWPFPEVTDGIVRRYRENYLIASDVPVTKDMVRQHMELEYRLTQTLLNSRPEERTKVWAASYGQLYSDLPWLAESSSVEKRNVQSQYRYVLKLIPPGSRVIEIGSGVGLLANYLTENGRPCVATEITSERGLRESEGVSWHTTDGIHLADFEPPGTYDAAVSMQVIEHFHPDDVEEHFRGALALLRPGGQYVFTTPHAFLGPADLSRVFSLDRPRFMHLKEYTHRELGATARRAGFRSIAAVYIPPSVIRRRILLIVRSRLLYLYLSAMERMLGNIRLQPPLLRGLLFRGDVFLVVTK